jgi:Caspase domain
MGRGHAIACSEFRDDAVGGIGRTCEKRVALVIGNAAYKNAATLQSPKNDARDVADALKRLGFETIVGLDLDRAALTKRLSASRVPPAMQASRSFITAATQWSSRRQLSHVMPRPETKQICDG